MNIQGLPIVITAFMSVDTMYFPPQEWADGMPEMNWLSTSREVHWIMRDVRTKQENMDIVWHFKKGDVVKIRMTNDALSMHPMSHPIHFHGQRLPDPGPKRGAGGQSRLAGHHPAAGRHNAGLSGRDDQPRQWMAHCHIAEHLEAGMMMAFDFTPDRLTASEPDDRYTIPHPHHVSTRTAMVPAVDSPPWRSARDARRLLGGASAEAQWTQQPVQ